MLKPSADFPQQLWSISLLKSQTGNFILLHENSCFLQFAEIIYLPIFHVWIFAITFPKNYSSTVTLPLSHICEIKIILSLPQTTQFHTPGHHLIFCLTLWYKFYFLFKIPTKLCFCHRSMFGCNISEFPPRSWRSSQWKLKTANFVFL